MNLFKWADTQIRKMRWYDMSFVKLSVFAFALMVAKLWDPILSLEWYWYLGLSIVFGLPSLYKFFGK